MAVLHGERQWMYWLGAQSDAGRSAELGYLGMATVIEDAHLAGARAVNLGASRGLPGVARFKRQFGAVDVWVVEHRSALRLPVAARSLAIASIARLRELAHRSR
jgi:hypothetical protein